MTERTLILVKPDGVKRGLTGQILARIEAKGYTIAELQQRTQLASCWPSTTQSTRASHSTSHWWNSCSRAQLLRLLPKARESSQVSARLQVLPIQPAQHRALSVVTSDATGA